MLDERPSEQPRQETPGDETPGQDQAAPVQSSGAPIPRGGLYLLRERGSWKTLLGPLPPLGGGVGQAQGAEATPTGFEPVLPA